MMDNERCGLGEKEMREFYFDSVDVLVKHLFHRFSNISPLKLQKSLYFLFGFYSGNYQISELEGFKEQKYDYPKYLFDADFEAWTYGPVIREVYVTNKNQGYEPLEYNFGDSDVDREISSFINDVSTMIMEKSDFALVDRSHEDKTWKDAIVKGQSTKMNKEDIAKEYEQIFRDTR